MTKTKISTFEKWIKRTDKYITDVKIVSIYDGSLNDITSYKNQMYEYIEARVFYNYNNNKYTYGTYRHDFGKRSVTLVTGTWYYN